MILNSNYELILIKFAGSVRSRTTQKLTTFGAKNPQDLLRAAPHRRFSWFQTFPFSPPLSIMNRSSPKFWRMFPATRVHFCLSRVFFKSVPFLKGGPLNVRHGFQPPPISPNLLRFSPNLQGMFIQASHINCEILVLKVFYFLHKL